MLSKINFCCERKARTAKVYGKIYIRSSLCKAMIRPVLFVLLLIVAACTSQQEGVVIAQNKASLDALVQDPCDGVVCESQKMCKTGQCVCMNGLKDCQGNCISTSTCCSDNDCEEGRMCKEQVCVGIPKTCGFNAQYNEDTNECECIQGTRFCDEQQKCIPTRNCCSRVDCKKGGRCVPTRFTAEVCIYDPLQHCRVILEKSVGVFTTKTSEVNITVLEIVEKGTTHLKINDHEEQLVFKKTKRFENEQRLRVEDVQMFGGSCEEE